MEVVSQEADLLRRFLRLKAVEEITGLRKTAIYKRIGQSSFPKPVRLGDAPNSPVVWPEHEIAAWQAAQLARRDAGTDGVK